MTQLYPDPPQTKTSESQSALSVLLSVAAVILLFAGPALIIATWRWAL